MSKQKKRRVSPLRMTDPTPDEIEERAAEIRSGWSELSREKRRVMKLVPLTFEPIHFEDLGIRER
jgi:hypothetical protein